MIGIELPLLTLGQKSVLGENAVGVLTEKAWLSSVKGSWSLEDFTNVIEDGPVTCGIAHSDYTDAEIEEWLENKAGSWSAGSLVEQEIAKRKIRKVGTFEASSIDATGTAVINDGKQVTTKCGWQLETGQTVKIWAYQIGTNALTTGSTLNFTGHANLWPN